MIWNRVWSGLALVAIIVMWLIIFWFASEFYGPPQVRGECNEVCVRLGDGSVWCKTVCSDPFYPENRRVETGVYQRLGDGSVFYRGSGRGRFLPMDPE